MNKNRRFVVSEFVKICDELDLLLEAIMLGMATAGNVTMVQVIHFQCAYFLSSLPSSEQAELVRFEIFLSIFGICWILWTLWFFRLCIIFNSFDSLSNWFSNSLGFLHIFWGFFLFFSTIFLDDIYDVFLIQIFDDLFMKKIIYFNIFCLFKLEDNVLEVRVSISSLYSKLFFGVKKICTLKISNL
jgi:hypothetical protein